MPPGSDGICIGVDLINRQCAPVLPPGWFISHGSARTCVERNETRRSSVSAASRASPNLRLKGLVRPVSRVIQKKKCHHRHLHRPFVNYPCKLITGKNLEILESDTSFRSAAARLSPPPGPSPARGGRRDLSNGQTRQLSTGQTFRVVKHLNGGGSEIF